MKRSTLTRTEKLMAAGYQPEGVCPGDNGKHSSGVSDRHAVLFKTMDDGSAFPLGMKYYERMIRQVEEKGKRRFERQFQDALQSLEAQLNVGYSMENAIKEVQRDLQIMYDRHTLYCTGIYVYGKAAESERNRGSCLEGFLLQG